MDFRKEMPKKTGWCWYLDTEWPVPTVGFIGPFSLFYNSRMEEIKEPYLSNFIRFGETINAPAISSIED